MADDLPRTMRMPNDDDGLNPDVVLDTLLVALGDELEIVIADRSAGNQTASVTLWVQDAARRRGRRARTRANVARSHRSGQTFDATD